MMPVVPFAQQTAPDVMEGLEPLPAHVMMAATSMYDTTKAKEKKEDGNLRGR